MQTNDGLPARWSAKDAARVSSAWRLSGMSIAAFARSRGLKEQRLSWWKKRIAEWSPGLPTASAKRHPAFAPVVLRDTIPAMGASPAVTIRLGPALRPRVCQLLLLLDGLKAANEEALNSADAKLRGASSIDATRTGEPMTAEPKRSPQVKKPFPQNLRRIENVIPVPDEERSCPKCGAQRLCIGHDVSKVVELIPAEVVVRIDKREKLACMDCEGELVRAPTGEKVMAGGRVGTRLVAQVLVDKYRDGLPLHRQKQPFARMGFDVSVSTLADQVTYATDLLRPLWRSAMAVVLGEKVMHLPG